MYDEENELDLVPFFTKDILIASGLVFVATFLITAFLL